MTSDVRTYIRVHDGMPDHPKIEELSDRAFRHLVTMWCYCGRHLTDGRVTEQAWKKRTTPATTRELLSAGLVERDGSDYVMHDYLDYQRSREQAEELSRKRREAGSKGGVAKAIASATADAQQVPKQTSSRKRRGEEKEKKDTPNGVEVSAPTFDDFYRIYPRKENRGAAERAWKTAVKKATPEVIIDGLREQLPSLHMQRRTDGDYRPHPASWLNGERWADQPTANDRGQMPEGW